MAYRSLALLLSGIAVLAGLASSPGQAADPVTPEQKEAFERIIHDYLLQHPEVLVQALQSAEDKMKAESEADTRTALAEKHQALVADPTSPVAGNPNGDVTIVEFFDYRCPYCKEVEPSLEALLRDDGKIRIVYKEFPILGKDSVTATRVALAAVKQGRYDAFHAAMMATKGHIDQQVVMQVAKTAGLDLDRVKKDMQGQDVDDIIKRNYDLAQSLDIKGTPAFIIGGELVPGAIDIAALKEKIAAARKAG
jgi:protein-disulfide isomerase